MAKPKYVIIEDNADHIRLLMRALARAGRASLPIEVGEAFDPSNALDPSNARRVRVMFCDLHLLGTQSSSDPKAHFALLAAIIDGVKPAGGGPWLLVLWTEHVEELEAFRDYLNSSLDKALLPVDIVPLPKAPYLADETKLPGAVDTLIAGFPGIQALTDWEESVADAVAETLSTLTDLASHIGGAPDKEGINRSLGFIAAAAYGKHAEINPFGAVTAVLAPLVSDRLINAHDHEKHGELWKKVVRIPGKNERLPAPDAARLNSMLHIEAAAKLDPVRRGTVSELPRDFQGWALFEDIFGDRTEAVNHFKLNAENLYQSSWRLLPYRAPCDDDQGRPGPLQFVLAAEAEEVTWFKVDGDRMKPKEDLSAAIWCSPAYERDKRTMRLLVSSYYTIAFPKARAQQLKPVFRLREQILGDLTFHLHAHAARP